MSSPAQILANQTNAALSTGPRTAEGKTASSQNALKFGLTSTQVVLPFEDAAEFEALEASIIEQINPANNTHRLLTDDVVVAHWKIRRNELANVSRWPRQAVAGRRNEIPGRGNHNVRP